MLRVGRCIDRPLVGGGGGGGGGGRLERHDELEVLEDVLGVRRAPALAAGDEVALLALEEALDELVHRVRLELGLEALAQARPELVHVLLLVHRAPLHRRRELLGRDRVAARLLGLGLGLGFGFGFGLGLGLGFGFGFGFGLG